MHADASGTARTWVWATDRLDVLAYYSIAPHLILRDKLPTKVGHGSPDQIPSVLLARLALDRSLQGQGLGAALLADALSRVVAGIEKVGGRLIVVDAIDLEAAGFYRRHGFVPTETDPRRLVIKASVVRRSL